MRTMFGRIAAYTAIAALLSITAAMASEAERPAPHKTETKEPEKHPTEYQPVRVHKSPFQYTEDIVPQADEEGVKRL